MIDRYIADLKPEFAPTVRPETPVSDVAEALCDPGASAIVVLEGETVTGVVTASDLVAMVAETDRYPTARSIMSSPAVTATPDTTLVDAAERMRSEGVRHLVVDEGRTAVWFRPKRSRRISRATGSTSSGTASPRQSPLTGAANWSQRTDNEYRRSS